VTCGKRVQHGQEKVTEIARGVELAAVDVDGVAECLKGVKRYSDGEDHTQRPEVGVEVDDVEQVLEGGGEEVEVFEEGEQANIGGDAQGEIFAGFVVRFAGFGEGLHAGGAVVIDAGGDEEGDKEAPVPTGIEKQLAISRKVFWRVCERE
jgi:carbon monoxide dehydrogenase subunit G